MLSDSDNLVQGTGLTTKNDIPAATTKSKISWLLVSIIFVVAILAFVGGFLFSKKANQFFPAFISESVDIPLKIHNPAVYRASFVYAFRTKVVGLEQKNGKTILKTDLVGIDNIPEFVIDNTTKIAVIQNGIETKITGTNLLTPGTSIYAYLSYNLIEKKWLTTRIAIVRPDVQLTPNSFLRPASTSANTKVK